MAIMAPEPSLRTSPPTLSKNTSIPFGQSYSDDASVSHDPEQKLTKCCAAGIVAWPGCHRTGGVGAHAIGLTVKYHYAEEKLYQAVHCLVTGVGMLNQRLAGAADYLIRLDPNHFPDLAADEHQDGAD